MSNHFCKDEGCINQACYFQFKSTGKQKVCAQHMQSDKPVFLIQLFTLMDTEEDHQSAKDRLARAEECRAYLNHLDATLGEEAEGARKALEKARVDIHQRVESVFEVQKRLLEQHYECAVADLEAARRELRKREGWKQANLTERLVPKQICAGLLQLEVANVDVELTKLLQSSFFLQAPALPMVLAYTPLQLQSASRELYFQADCLHSAEDFGTQQRAAFLCRASKLITPFKPDYLLQNWLAKKLKKETLKRQQTLEDLLCSDAHIMPTVWEHLAEAPAEAVVKYKKVIELSQSSKAAQACLEAAFALRKIKESEALALCSQALTLFLRHSSQVSLVKSACLLFAQLHNEAGTSALAAARLKEVLLHTGPLPKVVLEVAKIELQAGDLEAAETHLNEAYKDPTLSSTVICLQGDLHMKRKAHVVAEKCYREALKKELNLAQLLHVWKQFTLLGLQDESLECCGKAEKYKPSAFEYLEMAQLAESCNTKAAEQYYKQALEGLAAPGQEEALGCTWQALGKLYEAERDFAEAETCYSRALAEAVAHKLLSLKTAELSQKLGVMQDLQGRKEEAEHSFLNALRLVDQSSKEASEVQLHLAWLYTRWPEKQHQALRYFQSALTTLQKLGDQEGQARASDRLGRYYFAQGQYPQAVQSYTQVLHYYETLHLEPKELADICFQLGMACLAAKQQAKARHHLQESQRIYKDLQLEEGLAAAAEALALLA